jgi:hypothetical protein
VDTIEITDDTTDDTTKDAAAAGATDTAAAWMRLPLRAYLTGPDLPVTVTLADSGVDVVILRAAGTATVELVRNKQIVREADTALAAPINDPARQVELLRAALAADVVARQEAALTADQRRDDLTQLQERRRQTLDEIRDFAIEQYRDDELTRTMLDTFLEKFDLEPYRPRVTVTYSITGSFEVDSDDSDQVEYDVDQNLRVDLDEIDDVVEYSDNVNVSVTSVEPSDD